jgi:hypothetical protein
MSAALSQQGGAGRTLECLRELRPARATTAIRLRSGVADGYPIRGKGDESQPHERLPNPHTSSANQNIMKTRRLSLVTAGFPGGVPLAYRVDVSSLFMDPLEC